MTAVIIALACAVLLLVSCSTAAQQGRTGEKVDEADVKVELSTDPQVVHAGEAIQLRAAITGLPTFDGAAFAFDIRKANWKGLPELIDASLDQNNVYVASKWR